jgi:hypothetical protein
LIGLKKAGWKETAAFREIQGPLGRKDKTMKAFKVLLAVFVLAVAAYPQTVNLGMGSFSNEGGSILMAVDASMVNQAIGSPYSMFVLFMGAAEKKGSISVAAKDIVMVYKGQEYHMPSLSDLRKNYGGELRDLDFYGRLGKEGIISSWIKFYDFPDPANFFPPLTLGSNIAVTEGHMAALYGFMSPLYFKNPGFAKGDKLTIRVRDTKNSALVGECEVVLN